MFVYSLKSSKLKVILFAVAVVVIGVTAIILLSRNTPASSNGSINLKAETNGDRIAFLSQYGWEIDEEPVEISEVIIPTEFDKTYEEYNTIQKGQDFDLEKYKGERVKRYTYEVKNFPGYETENSFIRATLLVYDGLIIGGDVSSLEPDGFQQSFDFPQIPETTTPAAA